MDAACVRRAFLWACALDVQARKPGNVSWASPGHRMQAQQFIDSAQAAAGPLCTPGTPVGERIEGAMQATLAAVGCNTNLGIVLLCAPLAGACERVSGPLTADPLRRALGEVLQGLSVADARAAYRAIAATQPGGLGRAETHDVADEPTITLLAAMTLAAGRDRIARQYTQSHADLFDHAMPVFMARASAAPVAALQQVFLELLATWPDSHIVRKHGETVAHIVMTEAAPWRTRSREGHDLDADPAFAAWDESLKQRLLNPGTTADLCVATAMLAALLSPGLAA